MKNLIVLVIFFLWAGASVSAEVPESNQTPDVIPDLETTEAPVPAKFPQPQQDSNPESLRDDALIQSAYDGNLSKVEILVAKGASVNHADKKKRTPLMMAAYQGHTSIVEFLFGKGADINAKDSDDQTALFYTSKRSFVETTEFLLKNGIEVNAQSKKKRITALMIAAASGSEVMVRELLNKGADPALRNTFGDTAEIIAGKKGHSAIVEMLQNAASPSG